MPFFYTFPMVRIFFAEKKNAGKEQYTQKHLVYIEVTRTQDVSFFKIQCKRNFYYYLLCACVSGKHMAGIGKIVRTQTELTYDNAKKCIYYIYMKY